MRRSLLGTALLVLFPSFVIFSQPDFGGIRLETQGDYFRVGDWITNRVIISLENDSDLVIFPQTLETRGILDLVGLSQSSRLNLAGAGVTREECMTYVFRAISAGSLLLKWPDVLLISSDQVKTNQLKLQASQLIVELDDEPVYALLILSLGLVLVISGLAIFLIKKFKNRS